MKTFFKYRDVTDRDWNIFIDQGLVPDRLIRIVAFKIIENKELSEREMAIFCAETGKINEMIIKVSKR